mmetsp:Transcript_9502/g.26578  ORF Transcript_9502/g.26578 Transcript_9502/m.26578 type:complete len:110 (-) Transcript_9502:83-412(-)
MVILRVGADGVKRPAQQWSCQLCSQSRNTQDMDSCRTCGRPRGHVPHRYNDRLKEIRRWTQAADLDYATEEGTWRESWGLIVGLILLALIFGLIAWAFYEDQAEMDEEL